MQKSTNILLNFVIALFIISLFSFCNNEPNKISENTCYTISETLVKYSLKDDNGTFSLINLENVNPEHFIIIEDKNPENTCLNADVWAKDNMNVFYKQFKIKGADPSSFKVLKQSYAIDNKKVFFKNEIIPHAKVETFNVIGDYYATDNTTIWFCGKPISGIQNINTFKLFDGYFATDSQYVYLIDNTNFIKLEKANPKYFKTYNTIEKGQNQDIKFYSDSNKVYVYQTNLNNKANFRCFYIKTNIDSFQILKYKYYYKTNKNIYYNSRIIKGVDEKSFKTLGKDYSLDKNYVYYKNIIISKKPTDFKISDNEQFDAKDSTHLFLQGKII